MVAVFRKGWLFAPKLRCLAFTWLVRTGLPFYSILWFKCRDINSFLLQLQQTGSLRCSRYFLCKTQNEAQVAESCRKLLNRRTDEALARLLLLTWKGDDNPHRYLVICVILDTLGASVLTQTCSCYYVGRTPPPCCMTLLHSANYGIIRSQKLLASLHNIILCKI